MNKFWEFESDDTYRERLALNWADTARKQAFDILARSSIAPNITQGVQAKMPNIDEIIPPPSRSGGRGNVLKRALGGLDDVSSTLFMGDVRQPWDVLRPIQRLFEAEQKHVARPIARLALSPLPGSYEDLPELLRMGAETLFDPLTYAGPGALLKARKLPVALRLAAPAFDEVFSSPGSKRLISRVLQDAGVGVGGVLGAEAASRLGLPPIVGSFGGSLVAGRTISARDRTLRPNKNVGSSVLRGMTSEDDADRIAANWKSATTKRGLGASRFVPGADGPDFSHMNLMEIAAARLEKVLADSKNPAVLRDLEEIQKKSDFMWEDIARLYRDSLTPELWEDLRVLDEEIQGLHDAIESGMESGSVNRTWLEHNRNWLMSNTRTEELIINELRSRGELNPTRPRRRGPSSAIMSSDRGPIGPLDQGAAELAGIRPDVSVGEHLAQMKPKTVGQFRTAAGDVAYVTKYQQPTTGQEYYYIRHSDNAHDGPYDARGVETTLKSLGDFSPDIPPPGMVSADRPPRAYGNLTPESISNMTDTELHNELLDVNDFINDNPVESISSQHDFALLRQEAIKRGFFKVGGGATNPSWPADYTGPDPSSPEMQRILKSEEDALTRGPGTRVYAGYQRRRLNQSLPDQARLQELEAKQARGERLTKTERQTLRRIRNRAAARRQEFGGGGRPGFPPIRGGAPTSVDDLVDDIRRGRDFIGAKSPAEVKFEAQDNRSYTQRLRNWLGTEGRNIPVLQKAISLLNSKGIRFEDSSVTDYIDYWRRVRAKGPNFGSKTQETIDRVIRDPSINRISTAEEYRLGTRVTDPDLIDKAKTLSTPDLPLVDREGRLWLTDLVRNANLFDLTPDQMASLETIAGVPDLFYAMEQRAKLPSTDNPPNGLYAHLQALDVPVKDAYGQEIRLPGGPMVGSQLGRVQQAFRPEAVPSQAAGIDAGFHYLPFADAQGVRVNQGIASVADKWLNKVLEDIGKKPTDLLPPELVKDFQAAALLHGQLERLDSELSRDPRAWKAPRWRTVTPEAKMIIDRAATASKLSRKADRRAAFDALRQDIRDFQAINDPKYKALKEQRSAALKRIKSGGPAGPERTAANAPMEFRGRYYPLAEGVELQGTQQLNTPDTWARTLNDMNNNMRPFMATMDASFLGVQGLVTMFSNPGAWLGALRQGVMGNYDDYVEAISRSGRLDEMIKNGVYWAARNDYGEFIFSSFMDRLPPARISNTAFVHFGNVLRSELYDAAMKNGSKGTEAARFANLMSGFSPSDPSSVEKAVAFAPRFFRSQLGLLADAVSKRKMSNTDAAGALGRFIGLGALLTVTANEALGNDTEFDPSDPNFMRIRLGGQDVSVFGVWDTLAKAVGKTVLDGPKEGASYLVRSKASPVMARMLDIIEGETLGGLQLDASSPASVAKSAGELAFSSFTPIALQQLITNPPSLDNPAGIAASTAQFLGTKTSPITPSEQLEIDRETAAKEQFNKSWDQLEPWQVSKLINQGLDLPNETGIFRELDQRTAISDRYQQEQAQVDKLPYGKEWRDAYHDLTRRRSGAFEEWALENPKADAWVKQRKPSDPGRAKLQQYYQIFQKANEQDWTPDELSQKLDEFDSSLSPAQQAYIERNTGLRDTPKVKEYKAAQRVLKPYWEIYDEVWTRLRDRLPQGAQFDTAQDYENWLVSELQADGLQDVQIIRRIQSDPLLKQVTRATNTLQDRMRRADPEIDALLVKWYGAVPIRSRR